MRRARIKVQATVPVRRKVAQTPVPTESEKPPSTSNSVSDGEKITTVTDIKFEKIENAPTNETETERLSVSTVQLHEEPVISLPTPKIPSEIFTQNAIRDKRNANIEQNREENRAISIKKEVNVDYHLESEIVKVTNETDDSVINKEPTNSVTNKKTDDSVTSKELNKIAVNKETINVEVLERSIDGNNLNARNQAEKEIPETLNQHVEANRMKPMQNRSCFMRPVPRLDSGGRVRRNSVQGSGASASESEDDSRKSSIPPRVRNDSICSVQSNKDGASNAHSVSKLKVGQQKRRLTVSESARKLAEARREFMLRHENKTPDRNTLTMYDLIYYNPISNPMTGSSNSNPPPKRVTVCSAVPEVVKEREEEEAEDEPSANPVPQVKIGPNGELILDQKSLIIERTEKEKNRSGPIVLDESNSGGFYKRRQKSKEWSKWDTLRFYRALSNIGTDFLLMQSFFPNRTRQELKLKFKKEERTNKELVDKALKCQEFNLEVLNEEMAIFAENERKEIEMTKAKADAAKRNFKSKRPTKCRFVVGSIEEIDDSCEEDDNLSSEESRDGNAQKKSKRACKRKRKTLVSEKLTPVVDEEEGVSTSGTEDTEIYNVKPTRSGRLPKRRKLQAPKVFDEDSSDLEEEESLAQDEKSVASTETEPRVNPQPQDIIANIIPNARDIEPGSLVIITKESPGQPGETVMQVYMVSQNYDANDPNSQQNMTPIDLSPELLATVNSKISESEPVRIKAEAFHSQG